MCFNSTAIGLLHVGPSHHTSSIRSGGSRHRCRQHQLLLLAAVGLLRLLQLQVKGMQSRVYVDMKLAAYTHLHRLSKPSWQLWGWTPVRLGQFACTLHYDQVENANNSNPAAARPLCTLLLSCCSLQSLCGAMKQQVYSTFVQQHNKAATACATGE